MKTALQELFDTILFENELYNDEEGDWIDTPRKQWVNAFRSGVDLTEYVNKALQKEKDQIQEAYACGYMDCSDNKYKGGEDYFNETFRNEEV